MRIPAKTSLDLSAWECGTNEVDAERVSGAVHRVGGLLGTTQSTWHPLVDQWLHIPHSAETERMVPARARQCSRRAEPASRISSSTFTPFRFRTDENAHSWVEKWLGTVFAKLHTRNFNLGTGADMDSESWGGLHPGLSCVSASTCTISNLACSYEAELLLPVFICVTSFARESFGKPGMLFF